ncbi:MAG: DUF262 domain-containing protein [Persephonella sp.]|nr:DUF262 domain-containing protein [Persephonella sp.]
MTARGFMLRCLGCSRIIKTLVGELFEMSDNSKNLEPKRFLKFGTLLNEEIRNSKLQKSHYEWEKRRVKQFIKDLEEVFRKEYLEKGKPNNFEYLIGNMVFHKNSNGEYEIVDGQQRIVSLGIIFYVLNKNEDNNFLKLNLQKKTRF